VKKLTEYLIIQTRDGVTLLKSTWHQNHYAVKNGMKLVKEKMRRPTAVKLYRELIEKENDAQRRREVEEISHEDLEAAGEVYDRLVGS